MALNNDLNIKAGLEPVTQEEHEDITSTFSALADPELASDTVSILADSADAANSTSIDNVFYVNFNPKTETLSSAWQTKLESISKNVNLSNGFCSVKANKTVNEVVAAGTIPRNDEIKKANYLAKVLNHLVQQTPWIATTAINTQEKQFTVKKEDFHKALISNFTEGLNLPKNILEKLEGFLTNVKNTINNSDKSSSSLSIYIFVVIYIKDDVIQQWRPYVRTISFKPSQKLSTYTRDKGDESSGVNVDIDFKYVQLDGAFNNDLFESSAKPALTQSQNEAGTKFATSTAPLDVSVDD